MYVGSVVVVGLSEKLPLLRKVNVSIVDVFFAIVDACSTFVYASGHLVDTIWYGHNGPCNRLNVYDTSTSVYAPCSAGYRPLDTYVPALVHW